MINLSKQHLLTVFTFTLILVGGISCSASDGANGTPTTTHSENGGNYFTPHMSSSCVSTDCLKDDDCAGDERCNTSLSIPKCQALNCASFGEFCSDTHGDVLCKPELTCLSTVALFNYPWEAPFCIKDSCWNYSPCLDEGKCTSAETSGCIVGSTLDCQASKLCRDEGKCSFKDGACTAATDSDCRGAKVCKSSGLCFALGNECIAKTDEDCKNSEGCTFSGDCSLTGTKCGPSEQKCSESTICRSQGYCTLIDGECKAATPDDCVNSSLCQKQGTNCFFENNACISCHITWICAHAGYCSNSPEGTCLANSSEKCAKSHLCYEFGMCEAKEGKCVASDTTNMCGAYYNPLCTLTQQSQCISADEHCWMVPVEGEDCVSTSACKQAGACTLEEDTGRCIATSNEDCQASYICKSRGFCSLKGKVCAPGSDADCAQSKSCTDNSACTLHATGYCSPGK